MQSHAPSRRVDRFFDPGHYLRIVCCALDEAVARLDAVLAAERERWILWLPVAFGAGIAIYFGLRFEPPRHVAEAALLAAVALAVTPLARATPITARFPLLLAAALLAGLAAGQLRTRLVEAPVLARPGFYQLEGRIVLMEPRRERVRLLLENVSMSQLEPARTPYRVRVTASRAGALRVGDHVRLRARLAPPSPPSWPGGHDFARSAWFDGLGAIGYALGSVSRVASAPASAIPDRLAELRRRIAERAAARIPGDAGGVAAALLTGLRGGIRDSVWQAMQASGLAHLLAISGLHMGLVAGAVFLAGRYGFAFVPPLVLRVPARKPAALLALASAFCYLLLAGAPVPTQRAFVMIAIALVAVVIDRNPFSMRLVAVAATIVLALQPESVISVSFQMSFAAVLALVAWFEAARERGVDDGEVEAGVLAGLRRYLALVLVTTAVASLATMPFAAFHFQRVATYGALANLVAVPLTAFWIMPSGLLALVLHPFGLDGPLFDLMGAGVQLLLALAQAVAELPGASVALAAWPDAALALFVAGGLWLVIWTRRWRLIGLLPMAAGLALGLAARPPDLLLSPHLDQIAVRLGDGRVALQERVRDAFVRRQWLSAMLAHEAVAFPVRGRLGELLSCDPLGCVVGAGTAPKVALALNVGALAEDCRRAALVATAVRLRRCDGDARLLDGPALRRSGGVAVRFGRSGLEIETVRERRGDRPWASARR